MRLERGPEGGQSRSLDLRVKIGSRLFISRVDNDEDTEKVLKMM